MSEERQQAIDTWFGSEEGKSCSNLKTLGIDKEQYLRNRLWKAFVAGMDAQDTITRGQIIDKFIAIINSA